MRKTLLLGIAFSLLASSGAVFAYPSLLGPTGGANLPTASVAAPKTFSLAVDYFGQDFEAMVDNTDAAVPVRLLYGVTPNFEIGGTFTKQEGEVFGMSVDLDTWGINGKYSAPIMPGRSAWAVGAVFSEFTDSDIDIEFTQLYAVATGLLNVEKRASSPSVVGTIGVGWTNFSTMGDDENSIRPFLSADFIFPNKLDLNIEYQFKDSDVEDDPISSFILRYPFTENLSGEIGLSNALRGIVGTDEHDFLIGINYTFGTGRR